MDVEVVVDAAVVDVVASSSTRVVVDVLLDAPSPADAEADPDDAGATLVGGPACTGSTTCRSLPHATSPRLPSSANVTAAARPETLLTEPRPYDTNRFAAPYLAGYFRRGVRLLVVETAASVMTADGSVADREAAARRAFSTSMLVSATRCLLTYIVLPFVAPAFGIATEVGPGVGIAIGVVAIGSNTLTIRRFHAARHRWRWAYTAIAVCVMAMLLVLMVQDIADLTG